MPVTLSDVWTKPLPPLRLGTAFEAFLAWERRGLASLLPPSWRHWRYRPLARLVNGNSGHIDGDGEFGPLAIDRSFFGLTRLRAATPADDVLPMRIALPKSAIYETELSLPAEAASSLEEAVRFRVEEFSPAPAEEVVVAVGAPKSAVDGRLAVPVALARTSALDDVKRAFRAQDIAEIGANPGIDGRLNFVFQHNVAMRRGVVSRRDLAALFVGLLALALGFAKHRDNYRAALDAERTALLAVLKIHAHETRFLEDLPESPDAMSIDAAQQAIASAYAALPRPSFIETLAVTPTEARITYFAREAAPLADGAVAEPRQAIRRGFAPFSLTIAAEKRP